MTSRDVQDAHGAGLAVVQFGTILWVAAAAVLLLLFLPDLVNGLVGILNQPGSFATGTSKVIAGILLAFGLCVVFSSRRNLRDRLRAQMEEARRTQVETTLEKAAARPPYWP